MRKFLSILLTVALVLGSFAAVFAEVPEDVVGTEYEEAVAAMTQYGIITGYTDGTFRPERTITRAEMARLIIAALEMDDDAIKLYSSALADVGGHWAEGYVGYSTKLDIISGYPDKSFRPQNPVTYDEVITMIVRALGYTEDAGTKWPAYYVGKGTELGILKDIDGGSKHAIRGDVAIMLYRAMSLPIAGNKDDTMYLRHSTEPYKYEEWQIPYGERLINEYGLDGAVTDNAPSIMNSIYWQIPDFYNTTSNDNLTILTNFKTTQQMTGWSCGPTSALMVLEWYGIRGDLNEMDLGYLRQNPKPGATTLRQMVNIFEGLEKTLGQEWDVFSTFDANVDWNEDGMPAVDYKGANIDFFEFIPMMLKEGRPIIVGWNDWGGHYQVIIGYDTMGTETTADDVLILADPFDTTDHHQDGYIVKSAERLIYDFSAGWDPDYDFGIFLVATPKDFKGKAPVMGKGIVDDKKNVGRFTDTHMIPYGAKLADDLIEFDNTEPYKSIFTNWFGADGLSGPASTDYFRSGDYMFSPYYKMLDVFNLKSTKTRTMLEGYKSIQQATEYTCGVTSMLSVLEWFGKRGDLNELDLAKLRVKTDGLPGTTIEEMLRAANSLDGDWDIFSTFDLVEGDSEFEVGLVIDGDYTDLGEVIPYFLEEGVPIMVLTHEWGGHYQTVIGYDDMGTESTADDVIMLMDSYDTTDHNQDGYVIQSFERLIYDWTNMYDEDADWAGFVIMRPSATK